MRYSAVNDVHRVPRSRSQAELAIIIPCYNYERFVERAISSVVSQARQNCELVVVDDGSTDSSWELIRKSGVKAYRSDNKGARRACLLGLKHTTAPFVLFLDADDELQPGAIQTILSNLDMGVAKLQFPLAKINEDGLEIAPPFPELSPSRGQKERALMLATGVYQSPPTSGNVFRRDLCDLLFEVDYENWVDGILLFAAPFFGDIVSLKEPLGRYRIHGQNASGLGRLPDVDLLKRERDRFKQRMLHLRKILVKLRVADALVVPDQTYYFRERSFYIDIAEGRRSTLSGFTKMIFSLWCDAHSLRRKFEMTLFLAITQVLPHDLARQSLACRLDPSRRSTRRYLKAVLGFAEEKPRTGVSPQC